MAYTAPVTHATGDVFPASDWNTYIRDNLAYLHGDAGAIVLGADIGVGSASTATGAAAGILVDNAGTVWAATGAVGTSILVATVTGDAAAARFTLGPDGKASYGTGAGARDATFGRLAAAVLGDAATALSTGPLSGAAGGGGVNGIFVGTAGTVQSTVAAAGSGSYQAAVNGDSSSRWIVTGDGTLKWGPGAGGQDTTFARAAASVLAANAKLVESAPATTSQAAGTTFTPSLGNGLSQRVNVTTTGTLTIGSPGAPPAGFSGFLVISVKSAAATTTTLAWNAIFNTSPAPPSTGLGAAYLFFYNQGTAKWHFIQSTSE